MKTSLLRLLVALASVFLFAYAGGSQVTPTVPPGVVSARTIAAEYRDTSRPLRDIAHSARAGALATTSAQVAAPDIGFAASSASVVQNFQGVSSAPHTTSDWASDATGAPGPNHYMQTTNFSAAIFDKQGTLVMGPFPTSDFWDGFSGPCGRTWSDVIVLYDQDADRWFVSRFARQNTVSPLNWYQCFAISVTSDPTGQYYRYAFLIDAEEFNDYPKFGIWPDGYYMTADRDKIFPGKGNFVAAFDRAQMLNGNPAGAVVFKLDTNGNRAAMLPADWDGHTAPPAGAPNYLVRTLDTDTGWPADALEVWTLQVDWASAVFNLALQTTLAPNAFNSAICDLDQNCIPQPDPTTKLNAVAGGRLMFRLAYRNFGDHESLVVNHTVDAADTPDHGAPNWYELRRSGGNPWSIHQQSTYAPDATHRWIGSIAMDQAGNMAIGYTASSTSVFPSVRVATRLASDPLDTLTDELEIQTGSGSQTGFVFWADYSHMDLDPADDCTFWYTGTYQPVTSALQTWATRIAAFRFPGCEADLAVTKTRAPAGAIQVGAAVTYTITVTNEGLVWAGNVTLQDAVPAETAFVSLVAPAGWVCETPAPGASGTIACTKPSMPNGEAAAFTVVATVRHTTADGTAISSTATVSAETPSDPDPVNNAHRVMFTAHNPVPTSVQPPSGLRVSAVSGNVVTFRFTPPALGPAPTGYVLEGGVASGDVLASVPTGTDAPIFTIAVPTGSFYVRMHSIRGADKSSPSNEERIHVNVPMNPSSPDLLSAAVNGNTVVLAWRNTFHGGAPTNVILDVGGLVNAQIPLGLTETVTVNGVPPGEYLWRVRLINVAGPSSGPSFRTLTVPSPCPGPPEAPSNFLAYRLGNTVNVAWDPPAAGPAAASYVLNASGAFVGSLPTMLRALSGQAGTGSYTLSVAAVNPCGSSPATSTRTVVIP